MDPAPSLLSDAFTRIDELFTGVTENLDRDTARWRPDPQANPIVWLLWHLTRVQDDHISELAGVDQAWTRFRERFGLSLEPHDTGFGHTSGQVALVDAPVDLLNEYHAAVHDITMNYIRSLNAAELERVIDHRWQPPVTAGARLVSVNGDCLQHLGQAAYIRGMAERTA